MRKMRQTVLYTDGTQHPQGKISELQQHRTLMRAWTKHPSHFSGIRTTSLERQPRFCRDGREAQKEDLPEVLFGRIARVARNTEGFAHEITVAPHIGLIHFSQD